MSTSVTKKFIQAAIRLENDPDFTIEVLRTGVLIRCRFLKTKPPAPPQYIAMDNHTSWDELERSPVNPLLGAIDTLDQAIQEYRDVQRTPG